MTRFSTNFMGTAAPFLCRIGAWRLAALLYFIFPKSFESLPAVVRTACAMCIYSVGYSKAECLADLPSIREALREYHVALLFGRNPHRGGTSLHSVEAWAVETCVSLAFEFPSYIEWRIVASIHEE